MLLKQFKSCFCLHISVNCTNCSHFTSNMKKRVAQGFWILLTWQHEMIMNTVHCVTPSSTALCRLQTAAKSKNKTASGCSSLTTSAPLKTWWDGADFNCCSCRSFWCMQGWPQLSWHVWMFSRCLAWAGPPVMRCWSSSLLCSTFSAGGWKTLSCWWEGHFEGWRVGLREQVSHSMFLNTGTYLVKFSSFSVQSRIFCLLGHLTLTPDKQFILICIFGHFC